MTSFKIGFIFKWDLRITFYARIYINANFFWLTFFIFEYNTLKYFNKLQQVNGL